MWLAVPPKDERIRIRLFLRNVVLLGIGIGLHARRRANPVCGVSARDIFMVHPSGCRLIFFPPLNSSRRPAFLQVLVIARPLDS